VAHMVERARTALQRRLAGLLAGEAARYRAPADHARLVPDAGDQLREAARRVDDVRIAAARQKGSGGAL